MIPVGDIYADVADALLKEANGDLPYDLFNRLSRLAELKIIDYVTGDMTGRELPEPYTTQKLKDFVAPFISVLPAHINDGIVPRPADYYSFENMYLISSYVTPTSCDDNEDDPKVDCNTVIELLDGDVYTTRCNTYIKGLKPSFKKPIAKEVGTNFQFNPSDLGSIKLEYYRYPKFAKIVSTVDPTFNEEIIDVNASTNYEWDDKARNLLVFFIVDMFANRTSNQAQKEFNMASKDIRK